MTRNFEPWREEAAQARLCCWDAVRAGNYSDLGKGKVDGGLFEILLGLRRGRATPLFSASLLSLTLLNCCPTALSPGAESDEQGGACRGGEGRRDEGLGEQDHRIQAGDGAFETRVGPFVNYWVFGPSSTFLARLFLPIFRPETRSHRLARRTSWERSMT